MVSALKIAQIPSDPELPLLLDKVRPIHEIVKIDYFLPGCPPSADVFWKFLTDLIDGRQSLLCLMSWCIMIELSMVKNECGYFTNHP